MNNTPTKYDFELYDALSEEVKEAVHKIYGGSPRHIADHVDHVELERIRALAKVRAMKKRLRTVAAAIQDVIEEKDA